MALGIERRRIYDIVNILESFQVISRMHKNVYLLKPAECVKDAIRSLEVIVKFNVLFLYIGQMYFIKWRKSLIVIMFYQFY